LSGLAGLRRATPGDLDAVTALQRAAYAKNRVILGVEPLPLLAEYSQILLTLEVWLLEGAQGLDGALILEPRADDLLLWSVAIAPHAQGAGLGNRLLAAAEARARELGHRKMRLYTGDKLANNIAWYMRHGYDQERVETLGDRKVVHLVKILDQA
jgi:GNAT superfamily N-acetyltransferase